MGLQHKKIMNGIVYDGAVKPVLGIFKKLFWERSSNERFSVDENLPRAPVPPVNPRNIPEIPEEDQLLEDDEVQGQLPEADEVQGQLPEADEVQGQLPDADEVQDQLPEADEVYDLEDLASKLLEDEDLKDAVIYRSTKLFEKERGEWVAEPHVRVWSDRSCATV